MKNTKIQAAVFLLLGIASVMLAWIAWSGDSTGVNPDGLSRSGALAASPVDGENRERDATPDVAGRRPVAPSPELGVQESPGDPTTTWSARLVRATDGLAIAGATVRVILLSPDQGPEEVELVSDEAGLAGPISVDVAIHPGAEIHVLPGPEWGGASEWVKFVPESANESFLKLGPPNWLKVQVVDAFEDTGVPGAQLQLEGKGGEVLWETRTSTDGRHEHIWEAASGPFRLSAQSEGFVSLAAIQWTQAPGAQDEVRLLMQRAGTLDVEVVDGKGQPAIGVQLTVEVAAEALPLLPHGEYVREFLSRESEAAETRFTGLPRGVTLNVRAMNSAGLEVVGRATIANATGVGHVRLSLGEQESESPLTVVTVRDTAGAPVVGAKVGRGTRSLGKTDEHGEFSLPESKRKTDDYVWVHHPGTAFAWAPQPKFPGLLQITLHKESVLTGIVVDTAGTAQRFTRLTPIFGDVENQDLGLRLGRALRKQQGSSRERRTGADGLFEIKGLPPGRLMLHVRPAKGPPLVVPDLLPDADPVRIVLPREEDLGITVGLAFQVSVVDESNVPVENATVTAWHYQSAEQNGTNESKTSRTDSAGRARIGLHDVGNYSVSADADGYLSNGTERKNYPSGQHPVEIKLTACGSLALSVLNQDGTAAGGTQISGKIDGEDVKFMIAFNGGTRQGWMLPTDASGQASAKRLKVGELQLQFWADRGSGLEVVVEKTAPIRKGEETRLEVRLP